MLILPMLFGAFQSPSRHRAGRLRFFPWGREPRTCWHLAMSGAYIYILGSHTGTLNMGVTSNLYLRVMQHKEGMWGRFHCDLWLQAPPLL